MCKVFYTKYQVPFYLWRIEATLKYLKVPNYRDLDCSQLPKSSDHFLCAIPVHHVGRNKQINLSLVELLGCKCFSISEEYINDIEFAYFLLTLTEFAYFQRASPLIIQISA